MKIKTVGTGNIYVADRSACTLIDDHILVDCGNGIVKTLLQQGPRAILQHRTKCNMRHICWLTVM